MGWFGDALSTINPFDDKSGPFAKPAPVNTAVAPPTLSDPGQNVAAQQANAAAAQQALATGQQSNQTGLQAQTTLGRVAQNAGDSSDFFTNRIDQAGVDARSTAGQLGTSISNYGTTQGQYLGNTGRELTGLAGQAQGRDTVSPYLAQLGGTNPNFDQQNHALAQSNPNYDRANQSLAGSRLDYGQANQALMGSSPNFGQAEGYQQQAGQTAQSLQGIEAQEGPSAAQAQLTAGLDRSKQANLSMARSGRGFGASASSLNQAATQNAQAGQAVVNQSAQLRAQEDAAQRQRAAQNLVSSAGIQQGLSGQQIAQEGMRSQTALNQAQQLTGQQQSLAQLEMQRAAMQQQQGDVQAQMALARAQQYGGQQQFQSQLGLQQAQLGGQLSLQQQAQNDAYAQSLYGMGLQAQTAGSQLGLQGLGMGAQTTMGGEQMNLQAQQAAGQQSMAGYGLQGQLYGQGAGIALAGQGQDLQAQGQGFNMANYQQQLAMQYNDQLLQQYGIQQNASLGTAQLNEQARQAGVQTGMALLGAGANALGTIGGFLSDRDKKKDIEPANGELLMPTATSDTSGMGGPGGYDWGTGVSGPNQMGDTVAASEGAARGASVQTQQNQAYTEEHNKKVQADIKASRKSDLDKIKGLTDRGSNNPLWGSMQDMAPSYQAPTLASTAFMPQRTQGAPPPGAIPVAQPAYNPYAVSDEREKHVYSDKEAKEAVEKTPGFSYRYKDPEQQGAGPGRYFGVMAQDLEKTPAGKSTVREVNGTKMVDTSRLTMVNTAALNALTQQVDELKALVESHKKKGKKAA